MGMAVNTDYNPVILNEVKNLCTGVMWNYYFTDNSETKILRLVSLAQDDIAWASAFIQAVGDGILDVPSHGKLIYPCRGGVPYPPEKGETNQRTKCLHYGYGGKHRL